MPAISPDTYLKKCYEIAERARKQGKDPEKSVEIAITSDLAERVESLVGPKGIAARIRELSQKFEREELGLIIAREIVESYKGSDERLAEQAIRTSLAILTEGVVTAPLEGIVKVKIKENFDASKYLAIYFAGPIRSAGGSAQALAVLTADYVRQSLGLARYIPADEEIERFVQETELYDREAARLQYFPSADEIRFALKNIAVEITGEGTEKVEVSGYRDLPRIETNRLRGGAILVLAEGVLQKAPKIMKYVKKLKIHGWQWLSELKKEKNEKPPGAFHENFDGSEIEECDEDNGNEVKALSPNEKYIKEILTGRPLFSHPSAKGGFRLRYGRTRCSGLAAVAFHPATMVILDEFIAIGTQIKLEGPGKAGVAMVCDKIEPPVVKLNNGSVVRVESVEKAYEIKDKIKEILFLGDILIGAGEFIENNHAFLPSGYCEEWWEKELEKIGISYEKNKIPSEEEALELCRKGAPLHPRYTYHYHDLTKEELKELVLWLCSGEVKDNALHVRKSDERKLLEKLCMSFDCSEEHVIIGEYKSLLASLGISDLNPEKFLKVYNEKSDVISIINSFGIKIREKAPTYIGARMGRPEKAKPRKMSPPVNVLFPLGNHGGRTRDVEKAAEYGIIEAEIYNEKRKINLKELWENAIEKVGKSDRIVKGVIGLISEKKVPEALEKGILRANHGIYVFRDGTARFDATNAPLTHFKPKEIGAGVDKLRELGYDSDYKGMPLRNEEQIVEIKTQDIIIPEEAGEYLLKVGKFVDELLEKFYGLERFYNADKKEDLIGHFVLALAPHTSAAVLTRIIGFTKASVVFAHPFFHAAKRRNCDGDEDSVFLLLDALLNFSKAYLPSSRGGKMDAPLVLAKKINYEEIDDEAYNIDISSSYPLEFYEATLRYAKPEEVRKLIKLYEDDFSKSEFTHETTSIANGVLRSSYLKLADMRSKLDAQLSLAEKIRAVDQKDVARKIVETHFLPDLAGNLTKFSKQSIRCVKCNAKYRRVPLTGKCRVCDGKLVLTVSKGSIEKYLGFIKELIAKYELDNYLKQRVEILERSINSIFEDESKKQITLANFL